MRKQHTYLKVAYFDTMLGKMIAIADDVGLYLLEFVEACGLEREIEKLKQSTNAIIVSGSNDPIVSLLIELQEYFKGTLTKFNTPLHILGTPFQRRVWKELLSIPYGQTRTYKEQAGAVGNHSACRAVANAYGANQLAIVLPCHRVVGSNGVLGGYAGGIARKQWLINHEKHNA